MPPDPSSPQLTHPTQALEQRTIGERIVSAVARFLAHLVHFVVDGPDPVEEKEKLGMLEVWLAWPMRLGIVVAVVVAASMWRNTGIGQQIAWGLQVGALVLIAMAAAY